MSSFEDFSHWILPSSRSWPHCACCRRGRCHPPRLLGCTYAHRIGFSKGSRVMLTIQKLLQSPGDYPVLEKQPCSWKLWWDLGPFIQTQPWRHLGRAHLHWPRDTVVLPPLWRLSAWTFYTLQCLFSAFSSQQSSTYVVCLSAKTVESISSTNLRLSDQ